MIGQLIFAELPFACLGQPPYLEHGWIKECPEKDGWANKLTAKSPWESLSPTQSDWSKRLTSKNEWTQMPRGGTHWSSQERNDVNTVDCGWTPTNVGEK